MAPGPNTSLNPAVPNVGVVTGANASGLNHDSVAPIPPRIATFGNTWLARCVFPGEFKEVLEAVTENGSPVNMAHNPVSSQPRVSAPATPLVSHRLPGPKGN